MNNSKKLKTKKVKAEKISEKPITTRFSKPWIISSAILAVLLIAALLFDQMYVPSLMKIDGKNYRLKDLSYYFYSTESSYSSYSQIFGGQNIWDLTYNEEQGTTFRDAARSDAIDQALYTEILYNEATSKGYKLTDEEKKKVSENVASFKKNTSKEVLEKNNFTDKYLTDKLSKTALTARFKQDKIKELGIDTEKIKAGISPEEYREYDVQLLSIATQTTDESGKAVDFSADAKKAAYDKINALYEKAKTTVDWSTLISKDEKELKYQVEDFIASDPSFSENFKKMMMGMNNDQISEIYEDTTGYYIVRMVNNNSTKRYESTVEKAITDSENEAFDKVYEKIKAEHKYKLNDSALKKLKMGTVTLPTTTK